MIPEIPEGIVLNREMLEMIGLLQDDPEMVERVSTFIDILAGYYLKEAEIDNTDEFYRQLGFLQLVKYTLLTIARPTTRK